MTARPNITPTDRFTPIPPQEDIDRRAHQRRRQKCRTRWDFVAVWFVVMPVLWLGAVFWMWIVGVWLGRMLMGWLL